MKRVPVLLALGIAACVNASDPSTTDSPSTAPVANTTSDPAPKGPVVADPGKTPATSAVPSDSVVLATLKVEPTPGLIAKDGYRERDSRHGASESAKGYGRGEDDKIRDFALARAKTTSEEAGGEGRGLGGAPAAGAVAFDAPALAPAKKPVPTKEKRADPGDAFAPSAEADEIYRAEPPMPPPPGRPGAPTGGPIAPPIAQALRAPLTAGEIDDNAKFTSYLDYVKTAARGMAVDIDVSQRFVLKVTDSAGLPVHDARATLYVDGKAWLSAKTHSDGSAVLFPNAAGSVAQARSFALKIEKDGLSTEREVQLGAGDLSFTLDAKRADTTRLDLVFCIDTTGSMGDEITQIQTTIQDIIAKTSALPAKPELRLGMVLYGDRGDAYVTRVYDFTSDQELFKREVAGIQMTGGGDIPEDLNSGLEDAVESLEWEDRDAVRLVFLVGDAAPHLDYGQQYDYKVGMMRAAEQGIKIFPLASSGLEGVGEYVFRQLALFTGGRFLFLTYGANGAPGGDKTSMHVARQDYTPDQLDDLVIHIIGQELKPLAK